MRHGHRIASLALLVAALGAPAWSTAQAQSPAPVKDASVDDLVKQLAPTGAATRSLRNLTPERRQIDLVIGFDFDSAKLQPVSVPLLERLATAMKTPRLEPLRFKVEGHTDAKGSARYNEELSARRAQAVVTFLASQGVEGARLEAEGKGFKEPLDAAQPTAPENRRVRISTLP